MKNKIRLWSAMLCTLLLAACGSDLDYAQFIPKEAAVVSRIDVAQLTEKGNFADNEKLSTILKKAVQESRLTSKGKVVAEKIISDPQVTGIDFRKPIYAYYFENEQGGHGGIIAAVLNFDDLQSFVNYISREEGLKAFKAYKDVRYQVWGNTIIAFNDRWLIFKDLQNVEPEEAIDLLLAREDLAPEQTINSVESYKRMADRDGIWSVVLRGDMLAKLLSETNNRYAIASEYQNLANFDFIFDFQADDGKMSIDMETYGNTEEGQRKLKEASKLIGEIQGEYADYIDAEALFSVVSNVKGKEIINLLSKNGFSAAELREYAPYVEPISGDVAITMNALKPNLKGLDYRLFAHINNPQPYNSLRSTLANVPTFNEYATNEYSFSLGSIIPTSDLITEMGLADETAAPNNGNLMAYFGVHNSNSLFTCFSISSNAFDKVTKPIDKDYLHGRIAYVRFNSTNALDVAKLMAKNTGEENDYETKIGLHVLGLIDYLDFYATTDYKAKLNVVMRDKDKNALASFVEEFTTLINIFS
ncbi:MAG: DUF4836 family protein [Bacteroidaceae bacterium]|nr:DUF4836 family protein [Bacteroidaceae bacterium]